MVLIEALAVLFWMNSVNRRIHRFLFNLAAPALAVWISATVFFWFPTIESDAIHSIELSNLILPLAAFTTLYFTLNSCLVAIAVGLETGESPARIWWTRFTWLSVNYFSGASVAALVVTYMRELAPSALLVIVPLLVVSYLTFKTAMGRVEDSNRHLSELNRLYLSTIETLAMAIDAKDQITHGHIRRVQAYAVGLARHIGVKDHGLIRAIEAAALLHDMGKLAVPEYILNKPGKLSPSEFEKMKTHASVGADILSAVSFPYPVVPIVRHHHENWDGTGYPSGLKETDIPIGARILSVVDCFDALTSDRPYRPKLTDEEAIAILFERRGHMYDPLIVDMFVRVHRELAPTLIADLPRTGLDEITSSLQGTGDGVAPPLQDIVAGADEMQTVYELAKALGGRSSISETGDIASRHLRRLVPFSVSVLYQYDELTDELIARHSSGDIDGLTADIRVSLGKRLSGWVGANRKTIVNSDPALDLGEVARTFNPPLRCCLSSALISGEQLLGVLTLYSSQTEGFTDDHRRIVEQVANQMAQALSCVSDVGHRRLKDSFAGQHRAGSKLH